MNKYSQHIQNILLFIGIVALTAHSIITHRHTQVRELSNKVTAELVEAMIENNKVRRNQLDIQILEMKEKDKK